MITEFELACLPVAERVELLNAAEQVRAWNASLPPLDLKKVKTIKPAQFDRQ